MAPSLPPCLQPCHQPYCRPLRSLPRAPLRTPVPPLPRCCWGRTTLGTRSSSERWPSCAAAGTPTSSRCGPAARLPASQSSAPPLGAVPSILPWTGVLDIFRLHARAERRAGAACSPAPPCWHFKAHLPLNSLTPGALPAPARSSWVRACSPAPQCWYASTWGAATCVPHSPPARAAHSAGR